MIGREQHDGVTVLRLRHGKVNALDVDLLGEIADHLGDLAGEPGAVVLTGEGSRFSAGVDLRQVTEGGSAYAQRLVAALSRAFVTLFTHPRPVVAAVNGHAIAGGAILAHACDRRLMSAGTIGVTELLVGVPFPVAALEILRFAVGEGRAQELVLTGRRHGPEDARALGLVDEVVPPEALEERALAAARDLGAIPAEVFRFTKRQLRREAVARMEQHRRREDAQVEAIWCDPGSQAHMAEFLRRATRR